jgi:geranylgeranyl diphosphate synthase type II
MVNGASPTHSHLRWEGHRRAFEDYLRKLRFTTEARLGGLEGAMRYSMLAGGKRVRPAILAGDAFFGEALTLITIHQKGSCEQILEVVRELAGSTGVNGMVGGQVMDMDQTGRAEATDPETLYMIHEYKTGALIKSSARIGAMLAGATGEEQAAVSEYASQLGLCFQIVDDVLNATSTREELGKSAGSDAEQGKATFAGVFGLEGAKREADRAAKKALAALSKVDGDTSGLQELAYFVRHRDS